jgi:hypothetical protein
MVSAENGAWVKIPAAKINREESYDSQAHIYFPPNERSVAQATCYVSWFLALLDKLGRLSLEEAFCMVSEKWGIRCGSAE